MNLVKKIALAAVCLAAIAIADEGMKIGARLGYSAQSAGSEDWSWFGFGAGVAVNVPVGPVVVAPEVAFLYRKNYSYKRKDGTYGTTKDLEFSQPEFAVSIPIMVKYAFSETMYTQLGIQVDIPIAAEMCVDDDCTAMDGKEIEVAGVKTGVKNPERSALDLGIAIGVGYMIMPNLSADFRYVWGLLSHSTAEVLGKKADADPLSSLGLGVTYFF